MDILGFSPTCFRPPQGFMNLRLLYRIYRLGLLTVLWSRDSLDWQYKESADVLRALCLDRVSSGEILLFHDDMEVIVQVLPKICQQLKSQGYQLVTLSAMGVG